MKKIFLFIILVSLLSSCATTKYGCPSENQKTLNRAANRPMKV